MKKVIKLIPVYLLVLALFGACSEGDNTIDTVLNDFETGAILRTLKVNNAILNSSLPDSEFSVDIEEQDEQDGALLESVDVFVSIRDLTPDNGTTVAANKFVKSYPASDFTVGPVGLPRATIKSTFGEASGAMGLGPDDYSPGDLFIIELRVNLTDGRTYGAADAGGIITGGFFASPYKYNALLTCSPEPGNYRVDMTDSYGDGWQTTTGNGGDGIHVDLDGTIIVVGMCSPYGGNNLGTEMDPAQGKCTGPASTSFFAATKTVTIPVGTVSGTWNFPGDQYGEIGFAVYGPANQLLFEAGTGEGVPGLLPITLCAQ